MITQSLFRKNYLIFASIVLVFILIGFGSSFLYSRYEKSQAAFRSSSFMRDIFSRLDPDPRVALKKMNEATDGSEPFRFDLINQAGISAVTGQKKIPAALSSEELRIIESGGTANLRITEEQFSIRHISISKTREPGLYFVTEFHRPPKPLSLMWITVSILSACTLISVAIALLFQFSKYRHRAHEALQVLNEMRHGNLTARLPAEKFDDLAPLVRAFNQMADDLEGMVENLRKSDHARRQLLQDLAHDLRTPLASLKTFLETLKNSEQKLSEEKRHEVVSLCFSEVEYFGNLVEDLLFLAQITEPKYSVGTEEINLHDRIAEQIHVFKARYPQIRFSVSSTLEDQDSHLIGSGKLIDRLLRNAFENSTSFAKSQIQVDLSYEDSRIRVSILDDGAGFSEIALKEFGYKKASRVLFGDTNHKRISVGIGSVIMREIAQLHLGELKAENISSQGRILGAKVSFYLARV